MATTSAQFNSFTPEITSPDEYRFVNVEPIRNRITGDVMGVRWLRHDGTWHILRIEDLAYLEEILDDRMSFAAYPPSALKYLNDVNTILQIKTTYDNIFETVFLLTQPPESLSDEGGYPLKYRPFIYPMYYGEFVQKLDLSKVSGYLRDSLTDITNSADDGDKNTESWAKEKVINTMVGSNALTGTQDEEDYFRVRDHLNSYEDWRRYSLVAEEIMLLWYAFIQQMDIFIGADSNLSDEQTFKSMLPSFEDSQQLVDSWHDKNKAVPALKFERDGSSSFHVTSVQEPIRFFHSYPSFYKETFYIYNEPYKVYMNPRYTGRIAEMDAFVFFDYRAVDGSDTRIRMLRVPMLYFGTEVDVFGNGTESEVWALPMYMNNTQYLSVADGYSISTEMSPLYMIRLGRERRERYAFQAFMLIEWDKGDVDICAFWSGFDQSQYVGWSWGAHEKNLNGFSSTWNSSDNTQGGPEYVSISYNGDDPPPATSSYEVHCHWYTRSSGEQMAKVSCYDQYGKTLTAIVWPSAAEGRKPLPTDPGVRFEFDSSGNLTGFTLI